MVPIHFELGIFHPVTMNFITYCVAKLRTQIVTGVFPFFIQVHKPLMDAMITKMVTINGMPYPFLSSPKRIKIHSESVMLLGRLIRTTKKSR